MKAVGIIAEYNPFHNGHQWHLQEARRLSNTNFSIAIMSGNFMQRGEPAIFDKWTRAQMAVTAGVDLVIELPVAFAVRSAEYFATGGIRLLNALGVVSHVCFGAEHANISILYTIAHALNNPAVVASLHQHLEAGYNYAAAWGQALEKVLGISREVVASPNNILAVEYLRALDSYAPALTPLPISRHMSGYHDTDINGTIASATAIRKALPVDIDQAGSALPAVSKNIITAKFAAGYAPITFNNYDQMVLAVLRQASLQRLALLPDVSEGLEHKLKTAALRVGNIEELLINLKTKRYSRTRLQRLLIHVLLSTTKTKLQSYDQTGPLYARVLAFNEQGREILHHLKTTSAIPVITKTTHYLTSKKRDLHQLTSLESMLALDTTATDLYVLGHANQNFRRGGQDFQNPALFLSTVTAH
ncbi:MAG: hypothetical protein H6Q74_954 [Firmicutes bacterium]|nr:hypothetical protein [Bacillota bacterium]